MMFQQTQSRTDFLCFPLGESKRCVCGGGTKKGQGRRDGTLVREGESKAVALWQSYNVVPCWERSKKLWVLCYRGRSFWAFVDTSASFYKASPRPRQVWVDLHASTQGCP